MYLCRADEPVIFPDVLCLKISHVPVYLTGKVDKLFFKNLTCRICSCDFD